MKGYLLSAMNTGAALDTSTGLRDQGKIYVVIAVIALIFLGISIYLIGMDRRLSRLEKQKKSPK